MLAQDGSYDSFEITQKEQYWVATVGGFIYSADTKQKLLDLIQSQQPAIEAPLLREYVFHPQKFKL